MPPSKKRFYGEYITPSQLAKDYILPRLTGFLWQYLWVDLFCGEGSLIYPLLDLVPQHQRTRFFSRHILMFDIQKNQVEKAIEFATDLGIPEHLARSRILQRDTLRDYPFELFGELPVFHITNPPYLYRGYIAKSARQHLQYFSGPRQAYQDLYQVALFNDLMAGLPHLVYIIPTNFLFGDAVSNRIRRDFLYHYWIKDAVIFEIKVFEHTGTNVGIFFFSRKPHPTHDDQIFNAVKITADGQHERSYHLTARRNYRGGTEFEDFVQENSVAHSPKVRFYLSMEEVRNSTGAYKVKLLDANAFRNGHYQIIEASVNKELYTKITQNILFVRTVDTGGRERAGLYEIKKVFGVDGIVVTKSTFRTHPIQLFFDPVLSITEQRDLALYFNRTLENIRKQSDSEFMTTFRYSKANYTRKYLGLKQVKALISTYQPKEEIHGNKTPAKEPLLLGGSLFKKQRAPD